MWSTVVDAVDIIDLRTRPEIANQLIRRVRALSTSARATH